MNKSDNYRLESQLNSQNKNQHFDGVNQKKFFDEIHINESSNGNAERDDEVYMYIHNQPLQFHGYDMFSRQRVSKKHSRMKDDWASETAVINFLDDDRVFNLDNDFSPETLNKNLQGNEKPKIFKKKYYSEVKTNQSSKNDFQKHQKLQNSFVNVVDLQTLKMRSQIINDKFETKNLNQCDTSTECCEVEEYYSNTINQRTTLDKKISKHLQFPSQNQPTSNKKKHYPLNMAKFQAKTSCKTGDNLQNLGRKTTEDSPVDYSSRTFSEAAAVIMDAAARHNKPEMMDQVDGIKVRHVGDTTIVTENRDPFSFYWQLDNWQKPEKNLPAQYSTPNYVYEKKLFTKKDKEKFEKTESTYNFNNEYTNIKKNVDRLPSGWEKHEDPSGFSYYWHVDSGTIQRDSPFLPIPPKPIAYVNAAQQTVSLPSLPQHVIEEQAFRQTKTKRIIRRDDELEEKDSQHPISPFKGNLKANFFVRSLGSVDIEDENFSTSENISKIIHLIISKLSNKENDYLEKTDLFKWADGRELVLEIDDTKLILKDAKTLKEIKVEYIQYIRAWGVRKENQHDFAYVSRDPLSKRFLCHVFRCKSLARIVADTLNEACKKIIINRVDYKRESNFEKSGNFHQPITLDCLTPTSLKKTDKRITKEVLLTPIDEPKRLIRCHFIGVTQVPKATGIDVLNDAVDRLVTEITPERWLLSDVSVAPSTIMIFEATPTTPFGANLSANQLQPIAECRVRYLSFLGIGRNIKHCAFILHNSSSECFMCYVFYVQPSAALMAKTIEAACKLRYQKVLDAHLENS